MTEQISIENRQAILLAALDERYRAIAVIRERVQTVSLWALGLLSGAAGWIVAEHPSLSFKERLLVSITVFVLLLVLRVGYFRDLEQGFVAQQKVASRIETELGFYTPGKLSASGEGEGIYPEPWQRAGANGGGGRFFAMNHLLLYTGAALLLATLWV